MVVLVNALHIGQHQQLFRLQRACHLTGDAVRVNVVRFTGSAYARRGDDRNIARIQQHFQQVRVDLFHIADKADVDQVHLAVFIHVRQVLLRLNQVRVLAVQTNRAAAQHVNPADQVRVDLAHQRHFGNAHGFRIRHAQAADELALFAGLDQLRRNFRTAAMYHHRANARALQEYDILQYLVLNLAINHGIATILDHDGLALKVAQVRQCFY